MAAWRLRLSVLSLFAAASLIGCETQQSGRQGSAPQAGASGQQGGRMGTPSQAGSPGQQGTMDGHSPMEQDKAGDKIMK